MFEYILSVALHLVIGECQQRNAVGFEDGEPGPVNLTLSDLAGRLNIDPQLYFRAEEIDRVAGHFVVVNESKAGHPAAAKFDPEDDLAEHARLVESCRQVGEVSVVEGRVGGLHGGESV